MDEGPVSTASRLVRAAVPLLLAALLAGAAVMTVDRAGCETPARYVTTDSGVELIGGCVTPGVVPPSEDRADADRG